MLRDATVDCGNVEIKDNLLFTSPIIIRTLREYDDCYEEQTTGLDSKTRLKATRTYWDAPLRISGYIGIPFSNGRGSIKRLSIEYNLKSNPLKMGHSVMLGVYKIGVVRIESPSSSLSSAGNGVDNFPVYFFQNDFGFALKYRITFKPTKKMSFISAISFLANKTRTLFIDSVNGIRQDTNSTINGGVGLDIGFRYAFNKRHQIRLEISRGIIDSIQIGYAAALHK